MRIKLSVSRVSREWRHVAVEFLFNSIRIRDSRQVALLWYAFEGDAKRRGEQASKVNAARSGTAPWWVRELWIDLREVPVFGTEKRVARTDSPEALPSFNLFDLLKICPNILMCRVPGDMTSDYLEPVKVMKQVLGQLGERGGEAHVAQSGELNVPVTGRRQVELCSVSDYALLCIHYGDPPISTPHIITLPLISSLDLRKIHSSEFDVMTHDAIRLPNLVELALQGHNSLKYATARLILPSLQSVTLRPIVMNPLRFQEEPPLEAFLEKHGLALQELTVLEISSSGGYLRRLDQLCPVLQTLRMHYSELPTSSVPSVQTVGLYGLEEAGGFSTWGEYTSAGAQA
ncbi:hypothetical protein FRC00_012175 [Tulasnella sp. 408]|nr:hypothetical protein FRC00_012175 [Tulasnella sp. 408]